MLELQHVLSYSRHGPNSGSSMHLKQFIQAEQSPTAVPKQKSMSGKIVGVSVGVGIGRVGIGIVVNGRVGMDIVVTGIVGIGMVGFGGRPQLTSHSKVGPYAGSCTHLIYIIHCEHAPTGVPSMHAAPLSVVVELPDVVVTEEVVTCCVVVASCVVVDAGIVVVGKFVAHRPLTHPMLRVSVSRAT